MLITMRHMLALVALTLAAACSAPDAQRRTVDTLPGQTAVQTATVDPVFNRNVADLTAAILAMQAGIDPAEAARAAKIAYEYTTTLKAQYQITDAPIIHNIKVNRGTKPRGLCWHWAEDMEKRLLAENFQTLDLHRAIANHDNWRLEHSTAIVSAKGAAMKSGVVLDPWRYGGKLFWDTVVDDTRYNWTEREEVFAWKRERGLLTVRYVNAAGVETVPQ